MGSTFTWKHALTLNSTLSPFDSPLPITHPAFKTVKSVSWKRINIVGLLVTIYGLDELPTDPIGEIICLWLLHGRGDTQDSMGLCASAFLHAWNSRRKPGQKKLICVCFDQRNHGSRMIDNVANVSWKQGNPTHGPDMFNLYSGTAADVSLLITHLPSYLPFAIHEHFCGGVSLGGHATWQLLMSEHRIRAAMVVIGCPDYVRLMTDRAVRGNLATTTDSDPPGKSFVGSKDFPPSLVEAVKLYDPAGILLGELDPETKVDCRGTPSETEQRRLRPIMREKLAGKKILCLSGAQDRLVPYEQGEPFITWLGQAVDPKTGWCRDQGTELENIVDPNARHEFSETMLKEAERWLCNLLGRTGDERAEDRNQGSKL